MRIFVDLLNDVLPAAVGRYVVRMEGGRGRVIFATVQRCAAVWGLVKVLRCAVETMTVV